MFRRVCFAAMVAAALGSTTVELSACGDKFLRMGRSVRLNRYGSVHPSAILIYAPDWTPKGIKEFKRMLTRAGHKAIAVRTVAGVSNAFAVGRYDLVIASYADAEKIGREVDATPSRPAVLPVLYKSTDAAAAEAARTYRCVIRPDKMNKFQALEEIDRLMTLRSKGTTTNMVSR